MNLVDLPQSWRERAIVVTGDVAAEEWLSDDELRTAASFPRDKRRAEWALSRVAAKHLALFRGICADPKDCRIERPRIAGTDWLVSLSHSGLHAAAAIDLEPVGVDVETIRELPERASKFFLTDDEAEAMRSIRLPDRLIHFFSAKEAGWKRLSDDTKPLRDIPLVVESESEDGIRFEGVETIVRGPVVIALTRRVS